MKKQTIFFDIDGVLIEADNIRIENYKEISREMLKLSESPDYGGSAWIFKKLKGLYDKGVVIDPKHYKMIDIRLPIILKALKEKYKLIACSKASVEMSNRKLKATDIAKYFDKVIEKPIPDIYGKFILVDDRYTAGFCNRDNAYIIKFYHGQHKEESKDYDAVITDLGELIDLLND